jgi:hypothetical protein
MSQEQQQPPIVLEPQRSTDMRALARLLATLAWKRAQAVQSEPSTEAKRAA